MKARDVDMTPFENKWALSEMIWMIWSSFHGNTTTTSLFFQLEAEQSVVLNTQTRTHIEEVITIVISTQNIDDICQVISVTDTHPHTHTRMGQSNPIQSTLCFVYVAAVGKQLALALMSAGDNGSRRAAVSVCSNALSSLTPQSQRY